MGGYAIVSEFGLCAGYVCQIPRDDITEVYSPNIRIPFVIDYHGAEKPPPKGYSKREEVVINGIPYIVYTPW